VPFSALQYDSSLGVIVSKTEGTTDYSASSTSFASNAINFTVTFPRSIPADQARKFVLETM